MIIKQLTLATLDTGTLDFGFVGENEHIKYIIKCDSVFDEYPTATASLLIKAPDNTIYPKTVEVEGYNVGWVITASDTAYPGSGQIQLTFTEDGAVVKTVIANTNIKDSLVGDDPPPDPIADWISNANQILNKVDGMTATAESLPSGDDPSVTVETVDGHYNLEFGIPAGDPGDPTEIIDDNAGVGDTTKVWSANKSATDLSELKSDIDRKAPVILRDASGDIVSFADGADGMPLKDCVVQIDPVQSGTGDPSPSNVRPISGWTGANVSIAGKNLWPHGTVSFTRYKVYDVHLKAGSYELSAVVTTTKTDETRCRITWLRADDSEIASTFIGLSSQSARTASAVTVSEDVYKIRLYAAETSNKAAGHTGTFTDVMVEFGNTATDFVPYVGSVYAVDWQTAAGTVYGGSLDTVTGVLTVDRAKITLTGAEAWQKAGAYNTTYYITRDSCGVAQDNEAALCNMYKIGSAIGQDGCMRIGSNSVFFTDSRYTTKDAFAAAVAALYAANTPLEFVGRLETPLTYQLDPVQITALRESSIWADTGAVAVTYPADTRTYVDSAITAATDPDGNVIQVTGSTPSITGESGKRYICGTVDSISITPPGTGIIDVVFTSGTTPAVLTVPSTVRFPAWFNSASLDASTVYEINVQDGVYGAVMAWQT